MHDIPMHEVNEEFARCWRAAGQHLQNCGQGSIQSWLKADLNPPFLEHLSFRLGNQLFFVRLEDMEGRLAVPGGIDGLLMIAEGCRGHPCIMPMRLNQQKWTPVLNGWGLLDVRTSRTIDPPTLVSEALIEMTDWELHDYAVGVVTAQIAQNGLEIRASQGNPSVNPSIWFTGESGPEWVVVRVVRYPILEAPPPVNLMRIAKDCERLGTTGYFASVSVGSMDGSFDPKSREPAKPLWRGHPMATRSTGLVEVTRGAQKRG